MSLCETCVNAAHIVEAYWDGINPSSVEQRVKHQCTLVCRCIEAKKCNSFIRTPEYSCKNCLYLRQYDPFNLFCIAHCVVVQNDTVPCNDFKEKDF